MNRGLVSSMFLAAATTLSGCGSPSMQSLTYNGLNALDSPAGNAASFGIGMAVTPYQTVGNAGLGQLVNLGRLSPPLKNLASHTAKLGVPTKAGEFAKLIIPGLQAASDVKKIENQIVSLGKYMAECHPDMPGFTYKEVQYADKIIGVAAISDGQRTWAGQNGGNKTSKVKDVEDSLKAIVTSQMENYDTNQFYQHIDNIVQSLDKDLDQRYAEIEQTLEANPEATYPTVRITDCSYTPKI